MSSPRSDRFLLLALFLLATGVAGAVPNIELYGTFHAMGVIVTIDAGDDPDENAIAEVHYREAGQGEYRAGLPLSRAELTRFVGSLFWLTPGTPYEVRVTFSDPGGPLHGLSVEAATATRAEIEIPVPLRSFHISPAGSGSACTYENPCALGEGLSLAQAGDEIILRGGVYYEGEFTVPRSGGPGAPIVLRSHPGEMAVLDGADPAVFAWIPDGDGIYHTVTNESDPHVVLADGARLFPYQSLADLTGLIYDNTPGCFADDTTLYVHLAGGADPNAAAMVVSRYNHAFLLERDFVYFIDLTFRHYGRGSWAKGIYINTGSDNLIRGCTFASNDLGVGIKRASHRNVIEESEFYDTIFNWPWDGVKGVGGLEDGAVAFYSPMTGRGTVIRRNTVHDDFDGLGACPSDEAAVTSETDVYENLIYRMGDDGLETDGQCSNIRIWGNIAHDILMGISLAPVYDGPVYAIRNLIYRTGVGNNNYTGSPFKFNSGYDRSGEMYLFHNTCDAALPGNNGLYIKAPGTWDRITARNNIWVGTTYAVNNYNTSQPVDLDYDNLWNGGQGDLVRWDYTNYATLEAFAAATGQEQHGYSVESGFVNAPAGDYSLDPGSPLCDAGVVIPGINTDFSGEGPDIGAFEYSAGMEARSRPESWSRRIAIEVRPNPVRQQSTIAYRLSRSGEIELAIFAPNGRKIRSLHRGPMSAGEHHVTWDGRDEQGRFLGRGLYFVRLVTEGQARAAALVRLGL